MSLQAERLRRARLFPPGFRCEVCGEDDPIVLDSSNICRILCADHAAIRQGRSPIEEHHVAGWRYSAITLLVPANLHRRLTALQHVRAKQRRGRHEKLQAA
jgi:hypothetical protein